MPQAQALSLNNLPTPQLETWKYTNLPRALPQDLANAPAQEETIHIPSGQNSEQAVEVLFKGENNQHQTPSLTITLEDNAQATVIERHTGQGTYWKNMATNITLGQGAKLTHIRVIEDPQTAVQTNMVDIETKKDSIYHGFNMNLGTKMLRHEVRAIMNGPGSEITVNGLNLLGEKQHGDTTILIEHAAPHCRSNQFYRTLLDDSAKAVFQGKVHVHQIAQKTDGYQLSNAILLSDKAEMDTKPELEIYADDVKCSHGSTTGQLDMEPLFYLRSRGLSEAEAKMLLLQAFVSEVIVEIDNEAIEEEMAEKANAWLSSTLS